jgi:hypothetical protein
LQGDGSLKESRCRVWCPKDRLEHRSGARGETFGLKPGNLGPSSVTNAGEVGTPDYCGVVVSLSPRDACSLLGDLLRERVLDLRVRLLLATLEVASLESLDNESPNEVINRVSGSVEMA